MADANFEEWKLCGVIQGKKGSWNSPRHAILEHIAIDIQDQTLLRQQQL